MYLNKPYTIIVTRDRAVFNTDLTEYFCLITNEISLMFLVLPFPGLLSKWHAFCSVRWKVSIFSCGVRRNYLLLERWGEFGHLIPFGVWHGSISVVSFFQCWDVKQTCSSVCNGHWLGGLCYVSLNMGGKVDAACSFIYTLIFLIRAPCFVLDPRLSLPSRLRAFKALVVFSGELTILHPAWFTLGKVCGLRMKHTTCK